MSRGVSSCTLFVGLFVFFIVAGAVGLRCLWFVVPVRTLIAFVARAFLEEYAGWWVFVFTVFSIPAFSTHEELADNILFVSGRACW